MKFGKVLKTWAEMPENSENSDLVLRFKELKKQLKLVKPADPDIEGGEALVDAEVRQSNAAEPLSAEAPSSNTAEALPPLSSEERVFLQTLNEDLEKFNDFFIDKEEDFIIRIRSLDDAHDALQDSTDPSKLQKIRRGYCDLHGSMILLLHWSLLNFIAVIKILKKHDKHSGVLLRRPLLANVLKQPFNSTQRITDLIKQAEEKSIKLLEREGSGAGEETAEESSLQRRIQHQEELSRQTKAALGVWEELQNGSTTPSTVMPTAKRKVEAEGSKTSDTDKRTKQGTES